MGVIEPLLDKLPAESESQDLRLRLLRLMQPGEVPRAEIAVRSPRNGIYLATTHRILFVINERIGYRMGCVPYEEVTGVEHVRQRYTNVVHILHTSGKLLLTSTDSRAVRLFVAALPRKKAA